jgi:hypothetical protein
MLAVTKCLADRGHVDPDTSVLDRYVRPDVIDQFLLCDHLTWTLGKVDQDVQGPAAKGQRHTLAPQQPFANRQFERAKLQISVKTSTMILNADLVPRRPATKLIACREPTPN